MTDQTAEKNQVHNKKNNSDLQNQQANENLSYQVIRGTGISFSGGIIGKAISFAFHFLFARLFGPADYGVYALGDSILNITKSISTLGIDRGGVLKLIAVYQAERDQERLKGVILGALRITLGSSLLSALFLFGVTPLLSNQIFDEPLLIPILRILLVSLPFQILLAISAAVAQAKRQMKYNTLLLSGILPLTNLIGLLIAIVFRLNIVGLTICIVSMMVLSAVASIVILRKGSLNRLGDVKPKFENRELISISFPIILVSISSIVMSQADKLFIGAYLSSTELGIYNVAYRMVWTMQIFQLSLGIFPSFIADLFNSGKRNELRILYRNLVRWLFSLLFPLFLLINLFPSELMGIFGEEYKQGWMILVILSFFPLINGLTAQTASILRMTGLERAEAVISVISLIFNLLINFILINQFGVQGIAAGIVLTITLREIMKMIYISTKVDLNPYEKKLLYPFVVGLVSFFMVIMMRNAAVFPAGWAGLLVQAGLFIFVYLGLGWIFFPAEDRELLKKSAVRLYQKINNKKFRA